MPAKAARPSLKTSSKSPAKSSSASLSQKYRQAFLGNLRETVLHEYEPVFLDRVIAEHETISATRSNGLAAINVYAPRAQDAAIFGHHTLIDIVSDDRAFIIDSVIAYLSEKSYLIEKIVHPLLFIKRAASGKMEDVQAARQEGYAAESHICVQLNRRLTERQMRELSSELAEVMGDVTLSNQDWQAARTRVLDIRDSLAESFFRDKNEYQEMIDFITYVHDNNFTLLGVCDYKVGKSSLVPQQGSGLGLLSAQRSSGFIPEADREVLFDAGRLESLPCIVITKLSRKSTVHRAAPVDAILVSSRDKKGKITGVRLIIGLFTSVTYSRGLNTVPYLRYKAESVMRRAGFEGSAHSGRLLRHILEKYPRDDLFQIDEASLYDMSKSVMLLQEQPRVALYVRPDMFGRHVSCLVYIPRDLYDTGLRIKFAQILSDELGADYTAFQSTVDDSPLVRAIFTLTWRPGVRVKYVAATIEKKLQEAGRYWVEKLGQALIERWKDEDEAVNLAERYGRAFPDSYTDVYQARQAVHDIEKIEQVLTSGRMDVDLYKPYNVAEAQVCLKVYSPARPAPLSDILPYLENMGLHVLAEYPYEITPRGAASAVWVQDIHASVAGKNGTEISKKDVEHVRGQFESCLRGIWAGEIENDSLNKLIFLAGMPWRDVIILRSCIRYLRQTKIPFSVSYMEQALTDHPSLAGNLAQLFAAKFDPQLAGKKNNDQARLKERILDGLQAVTLLDQDRVLRSVLGMIEAALRTNFYQMDDAGQAKSWVSIKLDPQLIADIPEPRPYREIFVYSPRVEGIHLRGGPIARGGLRWSDRHEDFRTEVLGLMKAQQVKNSVIVPMGSKGGFVVKNPPKAGGREAMQQEGISCYKTYIRALLDVTDNRKGGKVVPPRGVVRLDGDDPYLVVAADKGTATFSDIANAISLEYGFWLGDAFASGGSAGYDHKKMGITARGSWESVKRHFRELNHNTQTNPFTVVGVGDMGGDVFGNGMLQSRKICMIGAFNHLHIFCDPNPDPEVTFKERQRLFKAVKGWDQYDTALLSKGGRIYSRSDKALQLTPEIQKAFDLPKAVVSPPELIRAMLKARVDLLYFGGIGTYVKASTETMQDAGDHSNDALRVDAVELRAKVIGEGANLGMTQRSRIEYARRGGRLNTDFIDNAAGVDTSDHEVNIKILLADVASKANSKLTLGARDKLLAEMTEQVGQLVLNDNYQQTQAISLQEYSAAEMLPAHAQFIASLERARLLNRAVEFLPADDEIAERARSRKGLTRPELSLIISYAKMTMTSAILDSRLPDEDWVRDWLMAYFPEALQKKYAVAIEGHQLRREIVATALANMIVNRMGPTFVRMTAEKTGAAIADVVTAYLVVVASFGLLERYAAIESLDSKVPALVQLKLLKKLSRLAERETLWLLTSYGRNVDYMRDAKNFAADISFLRKNLKDVLPYVMVVNQEARQHNWEEDKLPKAMAAEAALIPLLGASFDLIKIAQGTKQDLKKVAQVYFAVGAAFYCERLRQKAANLPSEGSMIAAAIGGLVDSLNNVQSLLTMRVLKDMKGAKVSDGIVAQWIEKSCPYARQVIEMIEHAEKINATDFAALVVIEQDLRKLVQG